MRVNAYQLASLIHPDIPFQVVSPKGSRTISVILIFLYGFLLCAWIEFVKNVKEGFPKMFVYLVEPILVIAVEIIAILVVVWFVKKYCRIPNILLFMAAVPIAGTCHKVANEFVDGLFPKKTSK